MKRLTVRNNSTELMNAILPCIEFPTWSSAERRYLLLSANTEFLALGMSEPQVWFYFILFFAMLELKIRWRWKLSIANIRGQHNGARRSLLEEQRVEQHLLANWGHGGRNFWRSRSRPCARTKGSIKRERVRQSKIGEFCTSAGTDINAVIDVTEKELWEQYHNRFN